MERCLYNGILSGMQKDGSRFFYVNPLEVIPGLSGKWPEYRHALPARPKWYACACCPPNLARLVESLGEYAWGENETTVYSHLYLGGSYTAGDGTVVKCQSAYPWKGRVSYEVKTWNNLYDPGHPYSRLVQGIYLHYQRGRSGCSLQGRLLLSHPDWKEGDKISLSFSIKPAAFTQIPGYGKMPVKCA